MQAINYASIHPEHKQISPIKEEKMYALAEKQNSGAY